MRQTLQTRRHETRVAEVHQSAESARAVERHHASRDGRGNGQRRALSRARARTRRRRRRRMTSKSPLNPNLSSPPSAAVVVAFVVAVAVVRARRRRGVRATVAMITTVGSYPRGFESTLRGRAAGRVEVRLARRSAKASSDARGRGGRADARGGRAGMGLGDARARGGETAAVVVVAVVAEVVAVAVAAVGEAGAAERAGDDVRVARVALAVRAAALVREEAGARANAAVGGGSVWACGTAPVGATVGRRRGGRARDARLRRDLRPVGVGALVATGRGVTRAPRRRARVARQTRRWTYARGCPRPRPRPRATPSSTANVRTRRARTTRMRTASWTRRAARARASSSSRADHPASSRRDSSGADPRRTLPGASLPATRDAPPPPREPESREATTGRLDA